MFSTSRGIQYIEGIPLVHQGDTMSTLGDVQYIRACLVHRRDTMMHVIQWTCPSWLVLRVQLYGRILQGHFESLLKPLMRFIKGLLTSYGMYFDTNFMWSLEASKLQSQNTSQQVCKQIADNKEILRNK